MTVHNCKLHFEKLKEDTSCANYHSHRHFVNTIGFTNQIGHGEKNSSYGIKNQMLTCRETIIHLVRM